MSAIGAVGYAASVYAPSQAQAASSPAAGAAPASAGPASAAANGAVPTASAPSGGLLAPGVVNALLDQQSELTPISTANLPTLSLQSDLTAGDRAFIAAATAPTGGTASDPTGSAASFLTDQIAAGRASGTLQGDVSSAVFSKLETLASDLNLPLGAGVDANAQAWLASQAAAGATADPAS